MVQSLFLYIPVGIYETVFGFGASALIKAPVTLIHTASAPVIRCHYLFAINKLLPCLRTAVDSRAALASLDHRDNNLRNPETTSHSLA